MGLNLNISRGSSVQDQDESISHVDSESHHSEKEASVPVKGFKISSEPYMNQKPISMKVDVDPSMPMFRKSSQMNVQSVSGKLNYKQSSDLQKFKTPRLEKKKVQSDDVGNLDVFSDKNNILLMHPQLDQIESLPSSCESSSDLDSKDSDSDSVSDSSHSDDSLDNPLCTAQEDSDNENIPDANDQISLSDKPQTSQGSRRQVEKMHIIGFRSDPRAPLIAKNPFIVSTPKSSQKSRSSRSSRSSRLSRSNASASSTRRSNSGN